MLRLAGGETLAALSRETGIARKSLYEWRNAYRKLGVGGLNRTRGPKPGWKARTDNALRQAQARIGELERVIGRQQVDLDFFQKALRLMDAKETQISAVAKSIRSSKP